MYLTAGRRLLTLLVVTFAVLGFLSVEIGERTGYQHVRALLRSDEAALVGDGLKVVGSGLKETLERELSDRPSADADAVERRPAAAQKNVPVDAP